MRLLVTGASGQLGGYLLREQARGDDEVIAWSGTRTGQLFGAQLHPVDLASADRVATAFRQVRPEAVLHAGAISLLSACLRDPAAAERTNTQGTAVLADLCAQVGVRMIYVSTDLVFDGEKGQYHEGDAPSPLSIYARTKVAAEAAVLAFSRHAVARVSLLFGPTLVGRPAFFDDQLAALRQRKPLFLFEDEWRTPLSLFTAARALLVLARSDHAGLLHVGGPERLSRLEMGQRLAAFLGVDSGNLVATMRNQVTSAEPRPRDTSLDSSRWREHFPGQAWPDWEESLREMEVRATHAASLRAE